MLDKLNVFDDRRETNILPRLSKAKINFDNCSKEDEKLI